MSEQNVAITTYTSTGRRIVIEETFFVDTIRTISKDPLAQTFSFTEDTLVTSIGLYFGVKGIAPLTVQLRNAVNGYPGEIAYASKTLQPSDVLISNNATLETKFTFTDPVMCSRDTQYCWIVMTEDTQYRLWVAKMGEKDIASGNYVPAQPFVGGTLFSSNDNRAWTAHQDTDAKFKIYTAYFDLEDSILNFNQVTGIEAAQIVLLVNQLVPSETNISWQVSQDGISNWAPIMVNEDVNLLTMKYTNCFIRAILSGITKSPVINLGAIIAVGIKFALSSKYINRNIVTLTNYTQIDIWADIHKPTGTNVVVKFSVNDGASWTNATQSGTQVLDEEFTQYHFKNTVSTINQFRIDLDITGTELKTPLIKRLMVTLS